MAYCVKCKSNTNDRVGSEQFCTTKNNRRQVKTICARCGGKKCQFIAGPKTGVKGGAGTFGNILGSVLGQILPF